MSQVDQQITDNVARVRATIAAAATRVGRDPAEITLVGVTKYAPPEQVLPLIAAGCRTLGESRPQELWSKHQFVRERLGESAVAWHLIGHLQRNKIARTLPCVTMIESIDRQRLLSALEEAVAQQSHDDSHPTAPPLPVLLEVNISGDATKHGWRPDELRQLVPRLDTYRHLAPVGLMAMASREGGRERARENFRATRALRDSLQELCPPTVQLHHLSMGMSGDYDIAIEEGATIVRVGSSLFEGIL